MHSFEIVKDVMPTIGPVRDRCATLLRVTDEPIMTKLAYYATLDDYPADGISPACENLLIGGRCTCQRATFTPNWK